MARYKCFGTFRDILGNVVVSQSSGSGVATVTVYLTGTDTTASIYDSATDTTAQSYVYADAYGNFEFYVDNFDYDYDQGFDVTFAKDGYTSQEYTNISMSEMVPITGTYTLTANKTVSTYVKGVKGLVYDGTATLTFAGYFEAGKYQCFGTSITITFGRGAVDKILPEWWTENTTPGTTDMGTAIQAALDSPTYGGIIFLHPTIYLSSIALTIPKDKAINLIGSGSDKDRLSGTEIRSTLRDGATAAITLGDNSANEVFHSIQDLVISGGTTVEISASKHVGKGDTLSNYAGLYIYGCHRGTLQNLTILGFDTYGLHINASYYWECFNIYSQYNGTGFKCVGANATSFYGCHAQYNIYGATDIQHLCGGSIQGNYKSGITYTESGLNSCLTRVWFEGNNNAGTGMAGEADIYADNTNYQNVQIDSCQFASTYAAQTVATHTFYVANFLVSISGATRFYSGNTSKAFYFKAGSEIVDLIQSSTGRMGAITDSTGATAFHTFTGVTYMSPDWGVIGAITAGDTSPGLGRYNIWKTANTDPTTITDFDDEYDGMQKIIIIGDDNTTIDFTTTNLKGNGGVDWSPITNDWMNVVYDGNTGYWHCSVHDCTA